MQRLGSPFGTKTVASASTAHLPHNSPRSMDCSSAQDAAYVTLSHRLYYREKLKTVQPS